MRATVLLFGVLLLAAAAVGLLAFDLPAEAGSLDLDRRREPASPPPCVTCVSIDGRPAAPALAGRSRRHRGGSTAFTLREYLLPAPPTDCVWMRVTPRDDPRWPTSEDGAAPPVVTPVDVVHILRERVHPWVWGDGDRESRVGIASGR